MKLHFFSSVSYKVLAALIVVMLAVTALPVVPVYAAVATPPTTYSVAGTTGPLTVTNATFACAGTNRLLVAVVTAEYNNANAMTLTANKGAGINFAQAIATTAVTRTGVWIGYLTEAQLAGNVNNVVVTETAGGNAWGDSELTLYCLTGVNQATPIVAGGTAFASSDANTGTYVFTNVAAVATGMMIYGAGSNQNANVTPPAGYTEVLDQQNGGGGGYRATTGWKASAAALESGTVTFGGNNRYAGAVISVNPAPAVVAPVVTNVTSPTVNGSYTTGTVITVQITFDQVVNVTGTPQLTLETGVTDRVVNYTSGSGTNTLTFTYTVQAGDTSADLDYVATNSLALNGGTIRNAALANATLTLPTLGAAGSLGANKAIIIDTTVPTVTINQAVAQADPTNTSPINFTVVFSKPVSGFIAADVTLSSGTAVVTGGPTTYNVAVSGMAQGVLSASLPAGAALDGAGNTSAASTSTDNQVTFDSVAPTVTINQAVAQVDPTNASPINFTVVFSESVSGFVAADVTLSSGTAVVTGGPTTYNVAVSGMAQGVLSASLPAGAASDTTGNTSAASTSTDNQVTFDSVVPTVTITSSATSPTNTSPIPVTITFSEVVSGFVVGDITVGNGAAGNFNTTDNITFTSDITPTANGVVTVDAAASVAQDGSGNNNTAATQFSITYDNAVPTVAITSIVTSPTNTSPIPVTITFSEAVSGFVVGDITVGNGMAGNFNTTDNITYTADITPTANGVVTVDVAASVAQDGSGNNNTAATQFSIIYDNAVPTVAITSSATNPTNTSPIPVTITFSEVVSGFVVGDITVGNGAAGNFNTTDNITFTSDITPTANGVVTVDVVASVAQDSAGNNNTAATQFPITYDNTIPSVAITSSATGPTNTSPIPVTITFSEAVSGFVVGDITVGNGTAGNFNTTDNITYTAEITPTASGSVTVDVAASVAQDGSGNNNTAATQFSIMYDSVNPTVASTDLTASYTGTGPGSFVATFSKAVDDPAGNIGTNDVTNPANYLLVSKGANGIANTASCAGGVVTDDTQVTVTSVSYNTVTFKATVTLASALPVGSYRLFICGTTSIVDLAGNHLNGGSDYTFDFVVQAATQQGGGGNSNSSRGSSQQNTLLPATGFPQNKVTILPFQPADKAYTSTDLWLEIPNIGVKMSIVGVTSTKGGWDVTWLDKKAGWLNGSAFPSWSGNSVLTGHVWDALNQPGPFAKLKSLKYGDQVKIHVLGTVYTYEITESELISNTDAKTVFKHEDKSVITLITCENYKEDSNTYAYRRMVRAMLVSVAKEK